MTNRHANIILASIIGVSLAIELVLFLMVLEKENPGCLKIYPLTVANKVFPNSKMLQDELYDTMVEYGYIDEEAAKLMDIFREASESETASSYKDMVQNQIQDSNINQQYLYQNGYDAAEQTEPIQEPVSEPVQTYQPEETYIYEETPAQDEIPAQEETYTEPEPTIPESSTTLGQQNALGSAQNYLSVLPFSYQGLIQQLEFDGYSNEESVYAADNCGANWNEQAERKAADYLSVLNYSRQGLIDQLLYDGFTQEQAEYGVSAVGY